MRIVFMGTPDFALPSLDALIASPHEIVGVVTQPDRPKGRGLQVIAPPVKIKALEQGLSVFQPFDLKDPEFLGALRQLNADCFAVVAYRILPPVVYEMPPKGCVNLHTSLLPKYRGAAPIQWAIFNGDTETGVTTFFIEKSVDTGAWIFQERTRIHPEDNAGTLHDRLAEMGGKLLLKTMDAIESGQVVCHPQTGEPTPAPKITPEHCRINWNRPAEAICNQIRAFAPAPGAVTQISGKRIKLFVASVLKEDVAQMSPGTIVRIDDRIHVQTGQHILTIRELQSEGKKRMSASDFLRGASLHMNDHFGADH